jgi:DNA replication protein DnaC
MHRLRECLPATPSGFVSWMSQNPAEKTWTCPKCGTIPPIAFANGWYSRRMCACERAELEAREISALREEQRLARQAYTYIWLGKAWAEPALAANTFATFRREQQPTAYDLARAFAAHPNGVLALYGGFGTGKTHLLAAVTNAHVASGLTCLFASVVSLFDAIGERLEHRQDYHDLLRRAIQTPLLALDDIDKLKPSEFREETLYKLLNGRCTAGLPLAISSNSTPAELERWVGKAGRSRLMQGLIPVPMNGTDYRMERQF